MIAGSAISPTVIQPSVTKSLASFAPPLGESRPTIRDTVESIGVCGTVMGAPSMLGSAFGWGGMAAGLVGVAAMTRLGVHSKEDRAILMPLALFAGAVAGVAGVAFGWPGAAIATGLGVAYGWKCA